MNHKQAFTDYCDDRGYTIEKLTENHAGITATITVQDQEYIKSEHFTWVRFNDTDHTSADVRLSYRDFENEAITDGLIESECSHFDKRQCEAMGHASYSQDGQSGPF